MPQRACVELSALALADPRLASDAQFRQLALKSLRKVIEDAGIKAE